MSKDRDVPELDPEALAETLLDAASAGQFETELSRAQELVESLGGTLVPTERFRLELLFFDLAMVSTNNATIQQQAAISALASAPATGNAAWLAIIGTGRMNEIERLTHIQPGALELLELLAYAPDDGIR